MLAIKWKLHHMASRPSNLSGKKRPDLVITDFMMPLMTGLELAQALRDDGELSSIPIILVSGAQASIGRSHPDMFNAVLDKPYDETRLLNAVDVALARRA
jgi:CheY-like chemotaxis protein